MARRPYAKNEIQDPSLPQKKRARWRVIGAGVLALAAMIILPFALESEPKRQLGDVAITLPERTELGKMDKVWPTSRKDPVLGGKGGMILEPERAGRGSGAVIGATAAIGAAAGAAGVAANAAARAGRPATMPTAEQVLPAAKSTVREVVVSPAPPASKVSATGPRDAAKSAGEAPRVAASKPTTSGKVATKAAPKVASDKPTPKRATESMAKPADKKLAKMSDPTPAKTTTKTPPIPQRRTDQNRVSAASPSGYVVQIGAYSSRKGARTQVARGKKLGYEPYVEEIKTPKGDRLRVRIGPYLTRAQADEARKKLQRAGIDTALIAP